jgi:hypothetical protein
MNLHSLARFSVVLFAAALLAAGVAGLFRGQAHAYQPAPTPTPPTLQVAIVSPRGGDALQGVVAIQGSAAAEGFQSAELAFAYQADRTGTWFLLWQSRRPVAEGVLTPWDTTTITDGVYRLRLQVLYTNGEVVEQRVEGLRVRNYSPVETSTPGAVSTESAARPTATPPPPPAVDYHPAAGAGAVQGGKMAPTNPAQVTSEDLRDGAITGAMAVLGGMLAFGLLLGFRGASRR